MSHVSTPVGGRILTRPFLVLAGFAAIAAVLLAWRFLFGIGATTALNDGYPWGLWIAFDVVVGTAIACGGYAVALMAYVLNRGRYHPLVRSAIVTSALGYTLAGFSVVIDLGRWWNVWGVPLMFWNWNLNSILLEVALCIMLYMLVLWLELSPAFLEKGRDAASPRIRSFSEKALPRVNRIMPWLIALGLLLPTMHQSSLGSLMLLAGPRLHALWLTPLLPLLFLISCLAMGYAAVIIESTLSTRTFRRPSEAGTLATLGKPIALIIGLYAGIRVIDLLYRGQVGLLLAMDRFTLLFAVEITLLIVAAAMLLGQRVGAATLMRAALLILLGGGLYRFSTFLFAFDPGPGWSYFPAAAELMITVGLVSAEIMAYIALVKVFPILAGVPAPRRGTGTPTQPQPPARVEPRVPAGAGD
jgi:Ni/Fe-hydrogenase subunit HybB-like protein